MNDWWRAWHGLTRDPKWRVIARACGQEIPRVVSVFMALCEEASQSADRGSIAGVKAEDLAALLDIDEEAVVAILGAMRGRVHDGMRLTGWDKRQPKREREDTASTERVREHRRRREEAVSSAQTLPPEVQTLPLEDERGRCNTMKRHETPRVESESEEIQNHTRPARANFRIPTSDDLAELDRLLSTAAGASLASRDDAPRLNDLSAMIGLLGPGAGPPCDLHAHVEPAIKAKAAQLAPGKVISWRFFVPAILEYRDACLAGAPPPTDGGPHVGPSPNGPARAAGRGHQTRSVLAHLVASELAQGASSAA